MKYIEAVLFVQSGIAEGFIRGFFRGRGDNSLILNMETEGIVQESFKEKIEEALHPTFEIIHLLISEEKEELLKEAISSLKKEGFLCDLKSERKHSKIKAQFKIEIYDAQRGRAVKDLLNKVKEVKVSFNKKIEEIKRDEKPKVELYAPEHSYELRGKGMIEGEIEPAFMLVQELRKTGVEIEKIFI